MAESATPMTGTDLPLFDDLPARDGLRSSWDVWPDRTLGCLNLLSEQTIAAASQLVRLGVAFALDHELGLFDPPLWKRASFRHEIRKTSGVGEVAAFSDDVLTGWNTQHSSQWDGFRHVERAGHGLYGGLPETVHGVDTWRVRGITGRAVLADVGRWRTFHGRPLRQDQADPIEPAELLACLDEQRVSIGLGDILLVRTGWAGWYAGLDATQRQHVTSGDSLAFPGLEASEEMARVLWNLRIAAVASDNPSLESWPAPPTDERGRLPPTLHVRLLTMLGMPIGELLALDDLAAHCAVDSTYEMFLVSVPLNLRHGAATPLNALAFK